MKRLNNIINLLILRKKIKRNISLNKTSIIAEIKKASPSAGIIVEAYNPIEIAKIYQQKQSYLFINFNRRRFFFR